MWESSLNYQLPATSQWWELEVGLELVGNQEVAKPAAAAA